MKIATAAYPLSYFRDIAEYEDKLFGWVDEAASNGADLLVFPEYAALELASLSVPESGASIEDCLRACTEHTAAAEAYLAHLAQHFGVHILGGSGPHYGAVRPSNRAVLFTPDGSHGVQDKQIMTRFEREAMDVVPDGPLHLFDTELGKIGILICYDAEFPLLGRALGEADIILAPSCTEQLAGYWRVRIGAMARALEQQCLVAMASVVGDAPWCPIADQNTGTGAIFAPPDGPFPGTGIIAEGTMNNAGWTYGDVDLGDIAEVRADGSVLNHRHWDEQHEAVTKLQKSDLRRQSA